MNLTLNDFKPINQWIPDLEGERWLNDGSPMYLIDQTTDRRYLYESKNTVRTKSFGLILGTPFVHAIAAVINVAKRVLKLISFSHFWEFKDDEKCYNFNARLLDACKDLLRIIAQPIAVVGLELAAIYGVFRPYDGRKLYASIERAEYESFILAPCFQPDPEQHLFGGNLDERNAY